MVISLYARTAKLVVMNHKSPFNCHCFTQSFHACARVIDQLYIYLINFWGFEWKYIQLWPLYIQFIYIHVPFILSAFVSATQSNSGENKITSKIISGGSKDTQFRSRWIGSWIFVNADVRGSGDHIMSNGEVLLETDFIKLKCVLYNWDRGILPRKYRLSIRYICFWCWCHGLEFVSMAAGVATIEETPSLSQ